MGFRSIFVFQLPSVKDHEISAIRAGLFDMLHGIPHHQFIKRPPHKLLQLVEWLDEAAYRDVIDSWGFYEFWQELSHQGNRLTVWREEQLDGDLEPHDR